MQGRETLSTDPADEALVARLARGESAALSALYERYSRALFVFCRHLSRADVAADLVHDIFLRVAQRASSYDPARAAFRTWLYRIARNRCIDWQRRRGSVPEELPSAESIEGIESVEGAAMRADLVRAVRECIAALKRDPLREALLLYHTGGKVYREIGEILGRSTSMARNLVKTAQESVRHCLEAKGVESTHG